jgi:hypothetical protein
MRIFEIEDQGNPEELLQYIKENCQQWLKHTANGQHKVYRGIGYESIKTGTPVPGKFPADEVFVKPIRTDRRALGNKFYREIYNTLLSDLGAKARRENSVPVTSDRDQADQFGMPYVFMPVGPFSYTWSPAILDWGSFDLVDPDDFEDFRESTLSKEWQEWEDIVYQYIKPTVKFDDWSSGALIEAIQSDCEIFMAAQGGLYIDPLTYQELLGV